MSVSDYTDLIAKSAEQYGIDPKLLSALIEQESSGNPDAVGPKTKYGTASGLAGILGSTANASGVDPKDPAQAIDFAARTLAANLKSPQSNGDVPTALKMYYGGPDTKKWGPNTAAYPNQVLAHYTKDAPTDADLLDKLSNPSKPAPDDGDHADLLAKLQGPQHAGWRANGTGVEWYDPKAPVAGTVSDVLKSGATGIVKGVGDVLGLPGDIHSILRSGASAASNVLSPGSGPSAANAVDTIAQAVPLFGSAPMPTSSDINSASNSLLSNVGLGFHTPQTIPGQYAQTAGEFAPGVALGGGGLATRLGRNVLAPAIGSETAGQLSDQNPLAKFAGGLAPSMAMSGARSLLGLGSISPERAALASKAIDKFGIDLRPSQIADQPFVKLLDSNIGKVPFSGIGPHNEEQMAQFSRAVTGTFGSSEGNLTPMTMKTAQDRIGGVFNRVGANTTIHAGNDLSDKLFSVLDNATTVLGDQASPIQNQIDHILSTVDKDGNISGKSYQALTAKNSPLSRGMASESSNVRQFVGELKDVLDDALQRSATPQDAADLRKARLQYKNLMTVKDLATKASPEGEISPALLLNAVRKSYKNMAFTGAGDIGDLGAIGSDFLKESGSSNTTERNLLFKLMQGVGKFSTGALGLFEAEHPEHILPTLGAAGLTVGTAAAIGRLGLKNRAYRNALLNAALNPPPSGMGNQIPATLLGAHNLAQ